MELTGIISTILSGVSAIIVAYIANKWQKSSKDSERLAERRKQETMLLLGMMHSTMELSLGIAKAMKTGHVNGDVETGIEEVQKAEKEYREFEHSVLAEELSRG